MTIDVRVRMDRLILDPRQDGCAVAHLISVVGNDADVGGIWAAILDARTFWVSGPGIEDANATLGDNGSRRTILCADDPAFVLYRIAQLYGLPVVPEWAEWFMHELQKRKAITPLTGLGCSPVVVKGTGKAFLHWIGRAVKCHNIQVPEVGSPISWPHFDGVGLFTQSNELTG